MFAHLDDPAPTPAGVVQRRAVDMGVARRRRRRRAIVTVPIVLVVLVGAAVAASALSGSGRSTTVRTVQPATPARTTDERNTIDGLTFRYPSGWFEARINGDVSVGGGAELIQISSRPLVERCDPTTVDGRARPCSVRNPVLRPGSVSVVWGDDGSPIVHDFRPDTTIDGRRASVTVSIPGTRCLVNHSGAESISALVPGDPDNYVTMQACLPAAHRRSDATAVLAMLRSLRL